MYIGMQKLHESKLNLKLARSQKLSEMTGRGQNSVIKLTKEAKIQLKLSHRKIWDDFLSTMMSQNICGTNVNCL